MRIGAISRWQAALLPLLITAGTVAQTPAPQPASAPSAVPYASVSELNLMVSQLQQGSQDMQSDLSRLRIEKWKTDSGTKRGTENDVESVQRNLQSALPGMITELRNSPDSLNATFKLYRNLDALYSVFSSVAETAGAFGSRDEYQSLQNDLQALEQSRRTFADRMEKLSTAKEGEIAQLRTELRAAQAAAVPPTPPKKIVVDDTEPPKPPVKKKRAVKKPPSSTAPQPSPPASSQTPNQPSSQPPNQ